ncbi:MAG: hypothetical protein R3C44_10675 [Chloroflexota bacterium]
MRIAGERPKWQTDTETIRASNLRTAFKYILTPGGVRNRLANRGLVPAERQYHAQSAEKGQQCIINVTPERAEFL